MSAFIYVLFSGSLKKYCLVLLDIKVCSSMSYFQLIFHDFRHKALCSLLSNVSLYSDMTSGVCVHRVRRRSQ
jgi:hypothetical protein